MKTYSAKPEQVERGWYIVDLKDQCLGRAAAKVASILRGKHRPLYTPHVDTGEYVIVVNADKVKLTGRKLEEKKYYRHTGYHGGLKTRVAGEMLKEDPVEIFKAAVKGMMPKNPLGRSMMTKLKVYSGPNHPHAAQTAKAIEL